MAQVVRMFYSRAWAENLPPGGPKEGQTIVTEYSDEELLNMIKEQGGGPPRTATASGRGGQGTGTHGQGRRPTQGAGACPNHG